jgi:hypothetical protein
MQSANYDSPLTVQGNSSGEAIPVTTPTGASASAVQGAGAHDSAIVGNPVRVGARGISSAITAVTTGDSVDLVASTQGVIATTHDIAGADSASNTHGGLIDRNGTANRSIGVNNYALNNNTSGTWDRWRNNMDLTILASAARTATNQSSDITNYNGRGMHLVIDVTAASATPSVVFTIQGKDALSGKYYTILASSAITGTGTTVLKVHPGITAAANASVSDLLPRTWRIDATHADSDSITYSVGASVIV